MPRKKRRPEELHTSIFFAPFEFTVHVIFAEDILDARTRRNDILGPWEEDDCAGLHCAAPNSSTESYIFVPYSTDINTIAHEACHAIWRLQKVTGADFCNETNAYHLAYLVQMIVRFMNECDEKYL